MKKLIILCLLCSGLLFAKNTDKYLNYVNQLINYNFKLKDLSKITPPFEIKAFQIINGKKISSNKIKKHINISLISIFNKSAYVLIEEYIGHQLVKKYFKWIKINDKIGNCKVLNITLDKVFLKCDNKILIRILCKQIPGIKEKR